MKKISWLLVALLVFFAIYELLIHKKSDSDRIKVKGVIESQSLPIHSHASGFLKKLYVKAGDSVKKGQVLACFNTDELKAKYQEALRKEDEQHQHISKEVEALLVCHEDLQIKDRLLDADEFLFDSGCITAKELNDSRKRQYISMDQYSEAWKKRFEAESDLTALCKETNKVLDQIVKSTIYSDFNGVIEESFVAKNQKLDADAKLFHLVNKGHFQVAVELDKNDLNKIHVGTRASMKLDDIPDQDFDLSVIHIEKDSSEELVPVKLDIEYQDDYPIRSGMNGMVIFG